MDRVSYVDIHNGLEETDAWLRTVGLEQNDRIRQSKRNLAVMAEASAKGTLGDLIADRNPIQRRELMWSLIEATEFVDAVDALRQGGCEIPKHVLEAAAAQGESGQGVAGQVRRGTWSLDHRYQIPALRYA